MLKRAQLLIYNHNFIPFILSLAQWVSAKIIRSGIVGQIAVGIVNGKPLADISGLTTFLPLGYAGLIIIIFESALAMS